MKKTMFLMLSTILLAFTACHKSDDPQPAAISIAFAEPSVNLTDATTTVTIKFSAPAPSAGSLTITYAANNVVYTTDFTTAPDPVDKTMTVPFLKDATSATFTFTKVKNAIEGEVKNVVFTITGSTTGTISGNKTTQLNFNQTASLGASLSPNVGGPTEPNQVYVDLSSGKMTEVPRVSWDLAFYSGDTFNVILNSSLGMSAKKLATTNIDDVQVADPTMIINLGKGKLKQVDSPDGDFLKTAIAEISAIDTDNKVYLINMGTSPSTAVQSLGKEGTSGASRGWKKIRILKSGNDYKIQYADIDATSHKEVAVTKDMNYNFTFFSLTSEKTVLVEPQKNQWDINFTAFIDIATVGPRGETVPPAPYRFPDFVVNNRRGGVKAYKVTVEGAITYDSFASKDVDNSKFSDDQSSIGGNWRDTVDRLKFPPVSKFTLFTNCFFVVKDTAGNIYKLKFTGGALENLERGHPVFQYALLK